MSTPPPPHRSALEACRSQLHVRARALHSPCSVTSSARPSADRSCRWRGWDSNPRSRAHEAREDSRSSTARRPREGESLVGRTRTCDLSMGEPMVPPRALSFPRRNLVGRTRTCDLRRPKSVGWPDSPTTSRDCDNSPAGLEPATRGVEALCSSAELRGDRRHSVSDFSRTPPRPSPIDDRGIEPRSTASSERRLPSRPVVGRSRSFTLAGFRRRKPTPSDLPAAGGDPSGALPLGGIALAN